MKSEKARSLVKSMERDYDARNKMINSTVAHQAVKMAEIELEEKAIEAYKNACPFNAGCCMIKKDAGKCECDEIKSFIKELNS